MIVRNINEMKDGWFVGNFYPTVYDTARFEVGVKSYSKGEYHAPHYHLVATEINYLISGKMKANGTSIEPGQIFVFDPGETAECEFLEDCQLVVVKTASVKGDKYENTKQ